MTREEAATILYNQWQGFLEDNIDYAGISDAYKMAIEALNDGKESKTISKDALIDQYITSDLWNAPYKGDEECR